MATWYQFMDKADAYVEAGEHINWIMAHPLQIILGLIGLAVLGAFLIDFIEKGKK